MEIFQWYIIQDPSFVMGPTGEPVFYDEELDLYVLGVNHLGTAWRLVPAPIIYDRNVAEGRSENNRCALYFLLRAHSRRAFYTSSLYA